MAYVFRSIMDQLSEDKEEKENVNSRDRTIVKKKKRKDKQTNKQT